MTILDPLLPCKDSCLQLYYRYWHPLDKDFHHGEDFPAILFLDEFKDTNDYLSKIHYNKRYGYRKAAKKGYFLERFIYQSFVGDVVEINTSKAIRAGGPMKPSYLETVEQRGGYPKVFLEPKPIPCMDHFTADFGVFAAEPGYKQGEHVTNKRLFAYTSLIVLGEYAIYSMIIGHGDYLKDEIMTLLHIEMFWYLKENTKVKYLEYHVYRSGTQGLMDWKMYFLFRPEPCAWKYPVDHKF